MGRSFPRPASTAIRAARLRAAPQTPLAALQSVWAEVAGAAIAAAAAPVSERDGTATIECESAVWAEELELMGPQLLGAIEQHLGELAPSALRFVVGRG